MEISNSFSIQNKILAGFCILLPIVSLIIASPSMAVAITFGYLLATLNFWILQVLGKKIIEQTNILPLALVYFLKMLVFIGFFFLSIVVWNWPLLGLILGVSIAVGLIIILPFITSYFK